MALSDDLVFAIISQLDIRELTDIELPCQRVDCLHLDWEMATQLTGRDYVVMRNVTSERGCKKIEAAKLRRYEEFSNCACQLRVSTCRHTWARCLRIAERNLKMQAYHSHR